MIVGTPRSVLHHLPVVDVDVQGVFWSRFPFSVFRQHFPDDVGHEVGVTTGVAADGLRQFRVELLNVVQVDGEADLSTKIQINKLCQCKNYTEPTPVFVRLPTIILTLQKST